MNNFLKRICKKHIILYLENFISSEFRVDQCHGASLYYHRLAWNLLYVLSS